MAQKARILVLAAVAAAALFGVTPTLAAQGSVQVASNDTARPTSAGDLAGNVNSFFNGLGKGAPERKPYEEYEIVSRGIVPGKGPGYCLKGEPMPHLNSAPNQISLALIPCSSLEQTGAFQRVAKATTTTTTAKASQSGAAGSTDREFVDTSNTCTYHLVPTSDGTGDQWCMVKDGRVIGRSHYTMNKTTGQYDETFTRLKEPVNIGVLKAGGGINANGKVTLPANVQAGWDNVDRIQREGTAKIEAENAARKTEMARNTLARKEAFRSKLGLD